MDSSVFLCIKWIFIVIFAICIILLQKVDAVTYGICLSKVEYQKDSNTGEFNKTELGNQSVRIYDAFTSLTNSCRNYWFRVKLYNIDTGVLGGVVVKMDEKKEFVNHDGAGVPETHYLKVARYDFKLLKSTVSLTWFYK